jgi:orotate phosphoribosyltransferase
MIDRESLVIGLFEIGAVQFGEFLLKSGETSPIYLDLRLLVSRPGTLKRVAHTLQAVVADLKFDRLACIPMAGLPIGVALSLAMDCPLVYPRMQVKTHGTGKEIEGTFKAGDRVLVIDDVISLGTSKLESIAVLEAAGLKIKDMAVLIDREMGGTQQLAEKGYTVHSALTLTNILEILHQRRKISRKQMQAVQDWLQERRV